jgi:ATP-dependent Clp protease adaptor protein ClpS
MTSPSEQTRGRTQTLERPDTRPLPPWHVVLLDDNEHTYAYVIRMMQEVFGHGQERAFQIAREVDAQGRAICLTTHKEHAELKRDQILAFGKDHLIVACKGSMSAVIEPAPAPE